MRALLPAAEYTMSKAPFFFSEKMLGYNMGPSHPLKPRRLEMTRELLNSYGLMNTVLEPLEPPDMKQEELLLTHSPAYLQALQQLETGQGIAHPLKFGLGTSDNPLFEGIYSTSHAYASGSAAAAQCLLEGAQLAFNIAGGLHHAHYGRAAGFCILNDCAVAIRRLRRRFEKVAYIDIDVHHGDGVQELFYNDPHVFTLSLHESGKTLFPGTGFPQETGEGAGMFCSANLCFAPSTTDRIWLNAWREAALPLVAAFEPDAIVLQMGTDTHALDPLGHLMLSTRPWLQAIADVQQLGKPLVAIGGGGYNLCTVTRMWTLAVAQLTGVELPNDVPVQCSISSETPRLRDAASFTVETAREESAERFAQDCVKTLKERLFPHYGLAL